MRADRMPDRLASAHRVAYILAHSKPQLLMMGIQRERKRKVGVPGEAFVRSSFYSDAR